MTPFLYVFYQRLMHLRIDWYLVVLLSGIAILYVLTLAVLHSQSRSSHVARGVLKPENSVAHTNHLPDFQFTPLQTEILQLTRDLCQLMKDAGRPPTINRENLGPKKVGEDLFLWQTRQITIADEWTKEYAEWARKLIYSYRQKIADRVKGMMHSLGADTGMVVTSLEPFTNDIRPEDFNRLRDILLDFFVKLEGGTGVQQATSPQIVPQAPDSLTLSPYPLTPVKLGKHTPALPSSQEVYRDKVQFVIRNSYDQPVEIWTPLWESTEVAAQEPLLSKFIKEGMEAYAGKSVEEIVVKLEPYREIQGWIGLMQPSSGDGLEVRLSHQNTGYLLFPLKVGRKLRYARVKI